MKNILKMRMNSMTNQTIRSRDVKMGFNSWAYPAHHKFEPSWTEKK